ncbi:hypothetical protein UCMB321_4256 [Pseudomonas batumici]|uniref:Uncharacterized protein n=1 Tax=Pseudomonas batumici TaxID=226910 RepID=A0A0C2HXQ0_9PSED|nr:hypothetical protein UCMB321_4256 [Pseudomonas batumici]
MAPIPLGTLEDAVATVAPAPAVESLPLAVPVFQAVTFP